MAEYINYTVKESPILNDACDIIKTRKRFMKKNVCNRICCIDGEMFEGEICKKGLSTLTARYPRDCSDERRRYCLKMYLAARWGLMCGKYAPKYKVGDILYFKKRPDIIIEITDLFHFIDVDKDDKYLERLGYPDYYMYKDLSTGEIKHWGVGILEKCCEKKEE